MLLHAAFQAIASIFWRSGQAFMSVAINIQTQRSNIMLSALFLTLVIFHAPLLKVFPEGCCSLASRQ
jgi:hypothetical protein